MAASDKARMLAAQREPGNRVEKERQQHEQAEAKSGKHRAQEDGEGKK